MRDDKTEKRIKNHNDASVSFKTMNRMGRDVSEMVSMGLEEPSGKVLWNIYMQLLTVMNSMQSRNIVPATW